MKSIPGEFPHFGVGHDDAEGHANAVDEDDDEPVAVRPEVFDSLELHEDEDEDGRHEAAEADVPGGFDGLLFAGLDLEMDFNLSIFACLHF
jgi:hypothetical protein